MITLDAMNTQHDTAKAILDAGADYVFTVKANRPKLLRALKALPWTKVPPSARSSQHGHGPRATCTIKVIGKVVGAPTLPGWPEFTGVAQIAQLRRTMTKAGRRASRSST